MEPLKLSGMKIEVLSEDEYERLSKMGVALEASVRQVVAGFETFSQLTATFKEYTINLSAMLKAAGVRVFTYRVADIARRMKHVMQRRHGQSFYFRGAPNRRFRKLMKMEQRRWDRLNGGLQ